MQRRFYRRIVLLVLLLGGMNIVNAARCDSARARSVAYNFCVSMGQSKTVASPSELEDVSLRFGFSDLHLFNLPSDGGFVIVSADDCLRPIIGYGFNASLTVIGDNMREWLRRCEYMVQMAASRHLEADRTVTDEWNMLADEPEMMSGSCIPALMSTTWNQSPYYNDSCPYDANAGTRVVTGCVATAMGQVMAYWKRPLTGLGSHSYTHPLYGTLSANFGATSYDWANMPYSLDGSSSSAEIRAEAQLVYHCGVAVEMGYGVDGSSSYVSSYGSPAFPSAENALRDYFRFKPSLHCIYEDDMTTEQWVDSIKNEFFAGRPVIFAGYQSSGGHAFVVDGCDAFDRVHVNWGWGGFGDGYFTLSPLPMYSTGCQAIVGVEPDGVLYGNKSFFNVGEEGIDDTLTIFSNNLNSSPWNAYATQPWITVSPSSGAGSGASAQLAIHCDSNNTGQNRSGNVIVRQLNDSIIIAIVQYGYNGIDQVLPEDDTITMNQLSSGNVQVDTIYPGTHYTILDPGGTGNYPSNCNSQHHLVSSQGSTIIMDVDYDIFSPSDWLRIFDSEGEYVQIADLSGIDSNRRFVCYSGHAFLSFHSDTYTPRPGYAIHIYVCDTFEAEVRNVASVVTGTNTITLTWIDTSSADQWRIKWGTDFRNLDQYREVAQKRAIFTNLDLDNYQYFFRIYNNAGAADTGNLCLSRLALGTPDNGDCPGSSITQVQVFDVLNHSVKIRWNDVSTPSDNPLHWKVRYGTNRDSLDLLAESDTNFILLSSLINGATYYFRIFNNTVSTDSASACFLMPISNFTTQWCIYDSMDIRNVTTSNVTGNSLDVHWDDFGGATQWTLNLFINNSTVEYQLDTPFLHIDNLVPGQQYSIIIYNNTGQTPSSECYQYHSIQTICESSPGQCVNFADINSCLVQPWTGDYDNPHISPGTVDNGPSNPLSRHTVVHINQPDPRTGNLLMTIPPGETASVRLGNWLGGAQSESISYIYNIDTNLFDLLILKYAAVLENPDHSPDEQPRFTLHITDSLDNPINDDCYLFDFISDTSLGWNTYGHNLWKDWTTFGVDLAPLHGQKVKVDLSTRDCNQGNHFGYAYYTLRCARKEITAEQCGNSLHNTFHVPEGFAYRWFEASNPDDTLSTTSSLTVDTAGDYRCALSPIGVSNPQCSFLMYCHAGYRYPHSLFTYSFGDTIDDCLQRIHFTNHSRVTEDDQHLIPTGEPIDNVVWNFGDNTSSNDTTPYHDFPLGTHIVTLYSLLNNGACIDTLADTIVVGPVCPLPDTLYASICQGDTFLWYPTDTIHSDTLTQPGLYQHIDHLLYHYLLLSVLPTSDTTIFDTIVQNSLPYTWNDTTFTSDLLDTGTAQFSIFNSQFSTPNTLACDSTVHLHLTVFHNRTSTTDTALCSSQFPFSWNNITIHHTPYTSTPDTLHYSTLTTHGADSLATLILTLLPSPSSAISLSPTTVSLNTTTQVLLNDISEGSASRLWILPDITDTRKQWTYSYPVPLDSVPLSLIATSSHGCNDTAYATIYYLNPTLYAPNAFTPDEASNNVFSISSNNLNDIQVFIYDRWGILVASWNSPDGSWNGSFNGIPCPQGAYVWLAKYHTLDAPNTLKIEKGTVMLIR